MKYKNPLPEIEVTELERAQVHAKTVIAADKMGSIESEGRSTTRNIVIRDLEINDFPL